MGKFVLLPMPGEGPVSGAAGFEPVGGLDLDALHS